MRTILLVFVFLGFMLQGVLAMDYYVDPVNGSILNPGTKTQPFQSITYAVSVAGDNDRIFLFPGTYDLSTGENFPIQIGPSAASDLNLEIVGLAGAGVTIIDAAGMAPSVSGVMRFGPNAYGARLSGVTVRNYPGGLAALRIGSSTAGFEAHAIEIENCVVENSGAWGIGSYGSSGALGSLKLHDNLIVNCGADGFWISSLPTGTGGGDVYNNTVVGCNNGFRIQGGNWNVVNNIVVGNTACGIFNFCDPTATPCAFDVGTLCPLTLILTNDWNDVFGNSFNYFGIAPGANSVAADPAFVNPALGNYHLQPTSSLIDAGYVVLPTFVETDVDGDPRVLDGNANFTPVPDIGADEVAKYRYVLLAGSIKQGSTASFNVTGVGGTTGDLAILFFSPATFNFVVPPYGTLLLDPLSMFSFFPVVIVGSGIPALVGPIPVDPALNGVWIYSQAAVLSLVSAPGLGQLTNRLDNQL